MSSAFQIILLLFEPRTELHSEIFASISSHSHYGPIRASHVDGARSAPPKFIQIIFIFRIQLRIVLDFRHELFPLANAFISNAFASRRNGVMIKANALRKKSI